MEKDNLPDLSLERDILEKLELTQEQKAGAEKFLDAIKGLKGLEEWLDDIDADCFIKERDTVINAQQTHTLQQITDEFLHSYYITGYDLGGNRVSIWRFPSQMSMDATLTSILDSVRECKVLVDLDNNK